MRKNALANHDGSWGRAMRLTTCIIGALAVMALSAHPPGAFAASRLPDKSCTGDCDVDVDPSMGTVPEKVTVGNGKGRKIRWTIRQGQGSFADNGIEFDAPGRGVFTICTASPNRRMFTRSNGGDPGQYKQTVRLQGRPAVDPFVINRQPERTSRQEQTHGDQPCRIAIR